MPEVIHTSGIQVLAAAACSLYERVTVCTFGNCRVLFMCANGNALERTVILSHHVVLTLRNSTFDVIVFHLIFHLKISFGIISAPVELHLLYHLCGDLFITEKFSLFAVVYKFQYITRLTFKHLTDSIQG